MHPYGSALELAAAIRSKEVSPTEVMDDTLDTIHRRNPALNAIIWLDEEDARARARAATDVVASSAPEDLPPFHGVPIPIKDLYDVAGWPNTLGSKGASSEPVPTSALAVERLVDGGFVLCGRSNSPEFGSVTATENERYGITRNPWNVDHTSGGSSGGASAAVASGMFTVAHASDGGGSIRIPATCTGLVGLKPARGRVTDRTVAWEGASTQGVVTRTVADTAAALDVMSRFDPLAWFNAPPPERPFAEEVGRDPGRPFDARRVGRRRSRDRRGRIRLPPRSTASPTRRRSTPCSAGRATSTRSGVATSTSSSRRRCRSNQPWLARSSTRSPRTRPRSR